MRCSLLLTLLAFCQILYSQKFEVNLSDITLSHGFSVDSVIDARPSPETLGYIFTKETDNFQTVFIEHPLDQSLKQILQKGNQSASQHTLIRIDRLFVYQLEIGNDRYFAVEAGLTFIATEGDDYIEKFSATKKIGEYEKYGAKILKPSIQAALDSCFLHYHQQKGKGLLSNTLISSGNLSVPYSPPIIRANHFPKGLFWNYYDLRDGIIDTETPFDLDFRYTEHGAALEAFLIIRDKKKRKQNAFAFSDGKAIFINTGKFYTQSIDTLDKLWLNRYPGYNLVSESAYTAGIINNALLFGPLGGGLFALMAKKPELINTYYLDCQRGSVIPSFFPEADHLDETATIFYGSSFLPEGRKIKLTINDSIEVKLARDQYFILKTSSFDSFKVCYSDETDELCKRLMPIANHIKWVKLDGSKKGPKLEEVTWARSLRYFDAVTSNKAEQVFPETLEMAKTEN